MTPSPARLLRVALPAAALALIPAATAGQAARESQTYRELAALMDVFLKVRAEYVDQVDDRKLIEGAINGMLSSLDPHSSYLDPRDFTQLRSATDGEYGGLGLTVTAEDGAVKVISPTDDTPAARAGLKAGDFITHLDGELIFGMPLNDAVDRMRGAPGSKIKLSIVRPGVAKPFDVPLTREVVKIRPVKWEVKGDVGVIRVAAFNRATGEAVRDAIAALEAKGATAGYVIDLRSNPGGLLDQAIEVSDAFLDGGEIASQRGRKKDDIERYYAEAGDHAKGRPLVVLVNEGSASAAEIVAGALQDHRRAVVLGQQSFGKGSVQTLLQLSGDTALRLTTARYFTPSGRSVQEAGIEPDILVPQLSDADRDARPRIREADLRRHLVNETKADDKLVEADAKPDPRFAETAESLKKRGVDDYQLDYAVKLIGRLKTPPVVTAAR